MQGKETGLTLATQHGFPAQRLLMDHNTGSGNTLLMLSALGNQFQDSQPKVAMLPEETVRDNL